MATRFDAFMQRALHDPEVGYYARHITAVGGRGDFTTAPMLSAAPARAIARWARKALCESRCRDLIEIGPGTGELAAMVWKSLPWWLRLRCRLHLVETSEPLAKRQRERLGNIARWHQTPKDALAACRGRAVIFSNELVDAFACRRFEKTLNGWQEIAVSLEAGHARESLVPCDPLPPSSIFEPHHAIGQRVEVHERYREWLEGWMPEWRAGRLLTIDYGAPAAELYQRQPGGSLRAYLLQHRLTGTDIYQNIGRQDLTADVNFTDLIEWSRPWTRDSRLHTFAEFLSDSGAPDQLTDPDGAGTAFRVLDQRCAVGP